MQSAERWDIVLCGFLCLQVSSALVGFERRGTSATYDRGTHSQGLCGARLSDTVSLVCGGTENINIMDNERDAPSWRYGYHRYKKSDVHGLNTYPVEKKILFLRYRFGTELVSSVARNKVV